MCSSPEIYIVVSVNSIKTLVVGPSQNHMVEAERTRAHNILLRNKRIIIFLRKIYCSSSLELPLLKPQSMF